MNLSLQSIVKRFGAVTAVDGVSLEIRDGECFFLLGPSGCGKTTLLRMIAGFGTPDEGRILFNGQPVNDLPPHRRNTPLVFQNYALWPHLTVFDNVAFGLTVPGRTIPAPERRERVGRMLAAMHMEDLAQRKPNRLSGGQQQRVALARALVIDPACLLLDEPLSNLDAKLRLEMRVEIRRLVKRLGITTIYVTHDQKEALSMADRCAILRQGRVEQIGSPRDLYERPANRFVADFIGGANLVPGKVRAVINGFATIATDFGEWTARDLCSAFQPGEAVALAIRPEALRLHVVPGAELNRFSGRLTETIYLGEATESWIRMSDGFVMKALESGPAIAGGLARPAVAAVEIPFHVNPGDVIVLAAE
ncbi:MAG: ABC transporter ATP-binding protein [Kiritimatiellae bacterium]|nr:ABC transporter ATP-binding protein [Verrucomicrobiota bacterium]MBU4285596.1 ABC transporter ATP-binding protein [Verrucomicrobiota bacterium]MCG2660673.1 ABC transporter ATP-binding protein [Kiritimatiellia bacterium]